MTTEEDGNTLDGTPPERFAPELERRGADVIGVNCTVGPAPMLETIERMAARDDAAAVGAAQRRQAARRRGAQHLPLLARVHGVVRAPLHPAQRAARRRLLRHDAGAHPADQGGRPQPGAPGGARTASVPRPSGRSATGGRPRSRGPAGPARGEVAARARAGARTLRRGRRAASPPRGSTTGDGDRAGASAEDPRRRRRQHPRRPAGRRAHERAVAGRAHRAAGGHRDAAALLRAAIGTCSASSRTCSARTRWGCATCCSSPAIPGRVGDYPDATAVFDVDSIGLTNVVVAAQPRLRRRRAGDRRADGFHIGVSVNPAALEPRRGAAALRVQGRGGRRVRGDAAGLRRRRASSGS